MSDITPHQLKEALQNYFSLSELRSLAFDLKIPYEDLSGEGKAAKVLSLVQFAQRHAKFEDVVRYVLLARPHVDFSAPTGPHSPGQPLNPPANQPAAAQYHFHGQVVGSVIGGGRLQAENIAGRDILIGQTPQSRQEFNDQLAALRQLLEEAIANGEIPDERDAADAVKEVEDALTEAATEQPRANRLQRYLTGAADILAAAAKTATAAGKAGLAVLKAAPIAAALVRAVQVLF